MKTFSFITTLVLLAACTSNSQEKGRLKSPDPATTEFNDECSQYYSFDGHYYDLDTYRQIELGGKVIDFKKCSRFKSVFTSPINDTVVYKQKAFSVNKNNYTLVVNGTSTTKMPVPNPLPEVHEYMFSLLPTTDGVVVIMEDYYGTTFTVLKYDEKGKELGRTEFDHTFITHPEPNTNHHHRYLYLGYVLPTQLVFTSHMAFGEKDKTVVVELKDLSKKEYDFALCGIVRDDLQQYVKGFVLPSNKGKYTIKYPDENREVSFTIENSEGACTILAVSDKLMVATYHPIATGSSLYCFDANTGKQLWQARVAQVMADHSEYYNTVYLCLYKNTIVMEGVEAYGHYLQCFDYNTGKRLACIGIPGEK
jgi:hypothetical protein